MPTIKSNPTSQGELWSNLSRIEGCRNPTLRWILHGFDQNFDNKLDELKTTWNQRIRDYYRDVLSLNTRRSPIRATYKLDDNGRFIQLIEDHFPDLDFAELVALRRYVDEVAQVQKYYRESDAQNALFTSKDYATARLRAYELDGIVRTLFDFYQRSPEADVFGKYYLGKHAIEIYVVPCIIFSMLIEEDFLDMAIGTLAHELAHAFHHVGADKDGVTWTTFRSVEPALIEGLAEYYTREFARTVAGIRPTILRTFEKTSEYLPETYRRYQRWGESFKLEAVYQELIEARRTDVKTFDDFQQGLDKANRRLGVGKKRVE